LILTPEIAWSIGNEIVMHRQNEYLRVIKAGIKALRLMKDAVRRGLLAIDKREEMYLDKSIRALEGLPEDEDDFIDMTLHEYKSKVRGFDPAVYEL